MSIISIQPSFPIFSDKEGMPLENGYIWIGVAGANPITNPVSVFWDPGLLAPAAQPIRTMGGYPVRTGSPARVYVSASDYSILVQDKNGSIVYSSLNVTERVSGDIISDGSITTQKLVDGAVTTQKLASVIAPVVSSINDGHLAGFRNRIMNGNMIVTQRGSANTYVAGLGGTITRTLDRWSITGISSGVAVYLDVFQSSAVPPNNQFISSLGITVTPNADTSVVASDYCVLFQSIEGFNVRDLVGRTFTLSFWVRSSVIGKYGVSFRNKGPNRSFVATYTVDSPNTWEYKSITVPGGLITSGNWGWQNEIGLTVAFALTAGSNYHTTPGSWQTGDFLSTADQANFISTVGNSFIITGVQLEPGNTATPFEHRPIETFLCQRYFYSIRPLSLSTVAIGQGQVVTTTIVRALFEYPRNLRIGNPLNSYSQTANHFGVTFANGNFVACSALPIPVITETNSLFGVVAFTVASGLVVGDASIVYLNDSTAFLGWDAEF